MAMKRECNDKLLIKILQVDGRVIKWNVRLYMRDSHLGQRSRVEEDQQRAKQKTIESMLQSSSMRVGEAWPRELQLSTYDVARKHYVKSMFQRGIREKIGKAIANFTTKQPRGLEKIFK